MLFSKPINAVAGISLIVLLFSALAYPSSVYAQAGGPRRGGTLITTLPADLQGFNPCCTAFLADKWVQTEIFNSLLGYNVKGEYVPNLAESWLNYGNGTWTFKLVKNATWHDGKPFTSADVKYTLETYGKIHPKFVPLAKDLKVETPDDYTVTVKFPVPDIRQAESFAVPEITGITPKHILQDVPVDQLRTHSFFSNPVGTGPFKFKEWVKGSHVTLERNENYFKKGLPYLDRLVIRIIPDPTTALQEYQGGKVDYLWANVPLNAVEFLKTLQNTTVSMISIGFITKIAFNLDNSILGKEKVRQAISYAVDRQDLAKRAAFGLGNVTYSTLPQKVWKDRKFPAGLATYGNDVVKANELLDNAGVPRGSGGVRFSFELTHTRDDPAFAAVAALLKDQLQKVGIDVKLKLMDVGAANQIVWGKREFDAYLFRQTENFYAPIGHRNAFLSENAGKGAILGNAMNYKNPEVDNLLDQVFKEFDSGKRNELLSKLNAILAKELPQVALYSNDVPAVVRADFKGDFLPQRIYVFYDPLETVWWVKGQPIAGTSPTTTTVIGEGLLLPLVGLVTAVVIAGALVAVVARRRRKPNAT